MCGTHGSIKVVVGGGMIYVNVQKAAQVVQFRRGLLLKMFLDILRRRNLQHRASQREANIRLN